MTNKKLSQYLTPDGMAPEQFMDLAILLARMLQYEHQNQSYLNCLHPGNILVEAGERAALLTREARSDNAYRAPEQYETIHLLPDGRSDLYVLGIILYELLTGHLPYQLNDAGDWELTHLTCVPTPVTYFRNDCPAVLEHILMKLLDKNMRKRYQTTRSLLRDLESYRSGALKSAELPSQSLGEWDPCNLTFKVHTAHLWGKELEQFNHAWQRVSSEQGSLILITGADRSGKTTLVHQFLQPLKRTTMVIEVKPTIHESAPFQAITSVLRHCFQWLWSESPTILQQMRAMVEQQIPNWSRIKLLQKELQLLFRHQVPALEQTTLSSEELEAALIKLLGCFAQLIGPAVVLLDEMEHADLQSWHLLGRLALTPQAIKNILLLVVYRATDIAAYADMDWRNQPSDASRLITLEPLSYKEVYKYMSCLLEDNTPQVHQLARLLYEQTGGELSNISSQVEEWIQQQKLVCDDSLKWSWSEELLFTSKKMKIDEQQFYAEYMALPEQTQQLLQYASCLHTPFDASLLLPLAQHSPEQLQQLLDEAEKGGYLARTQEGRHYFIHQQIKQLIYAREPEQQALWHFQLANWLGQQIEPGSSRFFEEVLEHWNLSEGLSPQQLEQRAFYNYQASQYWQDRRDFARSGEYAQLTIKYIEANDHSPLHSVLYRSRLTLAHSKYMSKQTEQATSILFHLLENSDQASLTEQVDTYAFLIHTHAFEDNLKTIQFQQEALSLLGWEMKLRPPLISVLGEILCTQITLCQYKDAKADIPENHEPEYIQLCAIIVHAVIPQLIDNPTGLLHFYARFVRYGLKKGMNDSFSEVLGSYALILDRFLPQSSYLPGAKELRNLGKQCLARLENKQISDYWRSLSCQISSPKQSSEYMRQAMSRGLEAGDINFTNFVWVSLILTSRENISTLEGYVSFFEDHLQSISSVINREIYQITRQYLHAMRGSVDTGRFLMEGLSPELTPLRAQYDNFESLCKLETAYLAGKYDIAGIWAGQARNTEFIYDQSRIRKQRIYEWLTSISHYEQKEGSPRPLIRILRRALRQVRKWKGIFGVDSAVHELLRAEWSKVHRQKAKAILQYRQAAEMAGSEQHEWLEGIIHERLALCFRHDSRNQLLAVIDACSAYARWGIDFKVNLLQQEYAPLFHSFSQLWEYHAAHLVSHSSRGEPAALPKVPAARTSVHSDQPKPSPEALVEATRHKQQHISLTQLSSVSLRSGQANMLLELLEQIIRQTGASGGQLVIWSEAQPQIMATPSWGDSRAYPLKLLRHTATTEEWTFIPDATQSLFSSDAYIRSSMPQAMLCAPVTIPGMPNMLIYLENRYIPDVFTERDKLIIELLISRMVYLEISRQPQDDSLDKPSQAKASAPAGSLIDPLTAREEEILYAMAEGLSNKDIALRLGIAETTVKTHATNLFSKLEVKRRGQAVARAKELGLIEL